VKKNLEKELREALDIAARIAESGRAPTDAERKRFLEIRGHLQKQDAGWQARLADEIDRLASALEGMGI
jgi:hypothetical protein